MAATEPTKPAPADSEAQKDSDNSPAKNSLLTNKRWLLWFVLLVSTTCFFDGCAQSSVQFTLGIVPYARLSAPSESMLFDEILAFWPAGLLAHLAIVAAIVWWLFVQPTRRLQVFRTKRMAISFCLGVLVMNSFLINKSFWEATVLTICLNTYQIFRTVCSWFIADTEVAEIVAMRIDSRLLFATWVATIFGSITFGRWFAKKYLLVQPDRWWQLSLRGLVILMIVIGVGAGLLTRWLMQ